ncbi:HAMP domain-containing sensor histidine kinase [Desulfohalovibrio reitneri]|uniref:HAMP domain-containing sensor histidine kinase n=1 Tax=Desulfohalovibrio reitneri TaxID=1307759 RepID=UPI0013770DA2|nr:ATP-binding protein [Desulfohalovibrio reitneri]
MTIGATLITGRQVYHDMQREVAQAVLSSASEALTIGGEPAGGVSPRAVGRIQSLEKGLQGRLFAFDSICRLRAGTHPFLGESAAFLTNQWPAICRRWNEALEAAPSGSLVKVENGEDADRRGLIIWLRRDPASHLAVGYAIPSATLNQSVFRFIDALLASGALSLLVLGLALALLLRRLLRPVGGLIEAHKRIRSGDFAARADDSMHGEIGELCRHFNAMARSLQEHMQTEQLRQVELDELNQELEKKVRLRTEALANKAAELQEANERLRELDKMKTAFLSSVSHELRTPLTSVLGFARLIEKDFKTHFLPLGKTGQVAGRGERITRNLDIIIGEGKRLTRLINDVLDLAKIESGRMVWNDVPFDVAEMCREVAATFRSRAEDSGLELREELEDGLPTLLADRDRILQILVNLLDNSLKFTHSGHVALRAYRDDDQLIMEVEDTGEGIPEDEAEVIFKTFHQASRRDSYRDKPAGTGLGLSICRQIIEHYGGGISAASKSGAGTTVRLTVPLGRNSQPDGEAPSLPNG